MTPLELFRRTADEVPAYRSFLAAHALDPDTVVHATDFERIPLTDKQNYHHKFPLPQRCRGGALGNCDLVAVSSGSSGQPTMWPRTGLDELPATQRLEQVFRNGFRARERTTLAVVCFPMGTWVGGLYTTSCLRRLAATGYSVTTIAPGNNKSEILRVLPELAPHFDQVVLLGYPPFLKDVIDTGTETGLPWQRFRIKLVFAGEVFNEGWRDTVAARAGIADVAHDTASLYGTADAGILANETPLTVTIRRFLAADPTLARELFGDSRLPTLAQYDPDSRFFETHDGTLVVSADGSVPLVRYHIADDGGLIGYRDLLDWCAQHGFDPVADCADTGAELPFVFVFGRALSAVSLYGANVFAEHVAAGLEQPEIADQVTGKFVMEIIDDGPRLMVTVELAPDAKISADTLAASITAQLLRLNSEYAHYVPAGQHIPHIQPLPSGDPDYFPIGVKHRYTRT